MKVSALASNSLTASILSANLTNNIIPTNSNSLQKQLLSLTAGSDDGSATVTSSKATLPQGIQEPIPAKQLQDKNFWYYVQRGLHNFPGNIHAPKGLTDFLGVPNDSFVSSALGLIPYALLSSSLYYGRHAVINGGLAKLPGGMSELKYTDRDGKEVTTSFAEAILRHPNTNPDAVAFLNGLYLHTVTDGADLSAEEKKEILAKATPKEIGGMVHEHWNNDSLLPKDLAELFKKSMGGSKIKTFFLFKDIDMNDPQFAPEFRIVQYLYLREAAGLIAYHTTLVKITQEFHSIQDYLELGKLKFQKFIHEKAYRIKDFGEGGGGAAKQTTKDTNSVISLTGVFGSILLALLASMLHKMPIGHSQKKLIIGIVDAVRDIFRAFAQMGRDMIEMCITNFGLAFLRMDLRGKMRKKFYQLLGLPHKTISKADGTKKVVMDFVHMTPGGFGKAALYDLGAKLFTDFAVLSTLGAMLSYIYDQVQKHTQGDKDDPSAAQQQVNPVIFILPAVAFAWHVIGGSKEIYQDWRKAIQHEKDVAKHEKGLTTDKIEEARESFENQFPKTEHLEVAAR